MPLQKITGQIILGQAVLVGYKLGLFDVLGLGPSTINKIAEQLNITLRSAQALVSCASAMELVESDQVGYRLTSAGNAYLSKNSDKFYGKVLDLLIEHEDIMHFDKVESAILSCKPQVDHGSDIFSNESGLGNTADFVASLHYKSLAPAFHWAQRYDLSMNKRFIDIGGGSGVHTIAACLNNKHLDGIVCDRKPVLVCTKSYLEQYGLTHRVDLVPVDMWDGIFPDGDVFFFGDIFHDWPIEDCRLLVEKCFKCLPMGGKILLHEMIFNEEKTGPFLTAAYNMKMMLWTEGQQYAFSELETLLTEAGFSNIKSIASLGNWSLISGEKL